MKLLSLIIATIFFFASCSQEKKEFSNVSIGMTQQEVFLNAGEPSKKKDIGSIELWTYDDASRTVVFKNDTVLDVLTSGEARIDSIEMSLKEAEMDIKEGADKAADKIDSFSKNLKNRISTDSLKN